MNEFVLPENDGRFREQIRHGQDETDPEKARDYYVEAFSYLEVNAVYRFSIARSNEHVGEEFGQEVLAAIYKAMPKFRGDSKVNTWIYSIARKTIAKLLKKFHKLPTLFEVDPPEGEALPDSLDELRRVCEEYGLMDDLRSTNRRVRKDAVLFLKHYILDVPLAELLKDDRSGMTKRQLRERLKRYIEKLRRRLEDAQERENVRRA